MSRIQPYADVRDTGSKSELDEVVLHPEPHNFSVVSRDDSKSITLTLGAPFVEAPSKRPSCVEALSKVASSSTIYMFCACAAVLYLMPLFAGKQFPPLMNSVLSDSLHSKEFGQLMAAMLAFGTPLLFELVLDYWLWLKNKSLVHLILVPRSMLVFSLLIPSLVHLCETAVNPTTYMCLRHAQFTCWNAIAAAILHDSSPKAFTFPLCFLFCCVEVTSAALDLLGLGYDMRSLRLASILCSHCFYLIACYLSARYCYYLYKDQKVFLTSHQFIAMIGNFSEKEYTAFAVMVGGLFGVFGSFLNEYLTTGNFVFSENFTPAYLAVYYASFALYIGTVIILPGRSIQRKLMVSLDVNRNFVRYVGHEIRTPLNVMRIGLDILEVDIVRSVRNRESLRLIAELRESCYSAEEHLNELLLYEKLESGITAPTIQHVYPVPFIVKTCAPYLLQARDRGVTLEILKEELSTPDCRLKGWILPIASQTVSQVLRNYVSNAIKFSNKGGIVQLKTSIVSNEGRPFIRIEVSDTGCGIPLKVQHKLFNEVKTNQRPEEGAGCGFGLVISKKVILLHKGRYGFFSEGRGKGATFFVERSLLEAKEADHEDYTAFLNRCFGDPTATHQESKSHSRNSLLSINQSSHSTGGGVMVRDKSSHLQTVSEVVKRASLRASISNEPKKHVLIVDDSTINRRMVRRMLEQLGYTCEEADDGDTGIAAYTRTIQLDYTGQPFFFIIMDNYMARICGPEASEAIRKLGYQGFIIALTGHALEVDIEEFKRRGADLVILKPIDARQFLEQTKDLLSPGLGTFGIRV